MFRDEKFYYSLSPPPLGFHPVDDFLFSTREGFCEHFASSLAVLARAGGLPARVVIGYQGGERNPFGDYWIVRQANAHAWVEVWLDGAWRRVDPTAAVAPERIERGIDETLAGSARVSDRLWRSNLFVNRLVLSWDAVNAAWDRWVLAYGPEMQEDLLLALGFEVPQTIQLAGLAGGATVICLAVMAVALRHRRQTAPGPRCAPLCGAVPATWLRSCGPVARPKRRRTTRRPSRLPGPISAPTLRTMTELYLRLRYGGVADPDLERRLAEMVRNFRPRPARARA